WAANAATKPTTSASASPVSSAATKVEKNVDRSNGASVKVPETAPDTGSQLVKTKPVEDSGAKAATDPTTAPKTAKNNKVTPTTSVSTSTATPEARLDSLIKSLSKADTVASKNTSGIVVTEHKTEILI